VIAFIAAVIALAVVIVVAALVDLSRREVRHLPKWAWALVIMFVTVPIGVIIYATVGRVSPHEGEVPQP
jgi:ABC-type tungstate transport system substrate-binding protein